MTHLEYPGAFNAEITFGHEGGRKLSVHGRDGKVWVEDECVELVELTPDKARELADSLRVAAEWADGGNHQ